MESGKAVKGVFLLRFHGQIFPDFDSGSEFLGSGKTFCSKTGTSVMAIRKLKPTPITATVPMDRRPG